MTTHKEAFCLMTYRCTALHELEIWNSRDGVTPFIVTCPTCRQEMQHVKWECDEFQPNRTPKTGDYVFVDLTHTIANAFRLQFVERFWDADMKSVFHTKTEAIERLAKGDIKGGAPHLTRWE